MVKIKHKTVCGLYTTASDAKINICNLYDGHIRAGIDSIIDNVYSQRRCIYYAVCCGVWGYVNLNEHYRS